MKPLSFLCAVFLLTAMIAGQAEAAKVCKPRMSGRLSNGATKALAQTNSVVSWQVDAAKRYALKWANWNNASSRSYACTIRTSNIGINVHYCRAKARPCVFQ